MALTKLKRLLRWRQVFSVCKTWHFGSLSRISTHHKSVSLQHSIIKCLPVYLHSRPRSLNYNHHILATRKHLSDSILRMLVFSSKSNINQSGYKPKLHTPCSIHHLLAHFLFCFETTFFERSSSECQLGQVSIAFCCWYFSALSMFSNDWQSYSIVVRVTIT